MPSQLDQMDRGRGGERGVGGSLGTQFGLVTRRAVFIGDEDGTLSSWESALPPGTASRPKSKRAIIHHI
ncbi:hypothetical protein XAP6164_70013 [Xanthomonas phaseoli pv. phaseoli]|nr:hypothetical protein XAP6164_70013 [Xanthomonas phaseoli pv. phaseoli]